MQKTFAENIETTTLPNGIRVVSETVTHVQSVSIGIWVGVGSRDEEMPVRGVTHFIEHMLFKGTQRRDARQIADEIESRGGSLNAFTDKEYTCYYAKALAEHAPIVMDVLTDMLTNSLLDPEELRREQNVVLEEIKRYKDTPDDIVHDLFIETLWNTHPLGRPVIGIERTVAGLTRESVVDYMARHYTPDRIVVAAAGNVPHAEIVALAAKHLGHLSGKQEKPRSRQPHASGKEKFLRKRTEQVHFCYGTTGFRQGDDSRFAMTILDTVLGGNMSSRLFQEIREKRGLAYSIGSYSVSYREGGLFTVFGGTSPDTYEQVLDLTRIEIEKVKRENLSEDEVAKSKTQIRGALVLGLENMSSRMMRMGKSTLYFDRVVPLEEIQSKINAITLDDLDRVTNQIFDPEKMTLAAVGPFKKTREKAVEADA
jgi:predicted Zn-dependent peptidase